jgi:hypothetical protein
VKVKLENVRIAFCQNLFKKGGEYDRFDSRFIIPPKHPAVKLIDDAIERVANEHPKWKGKAPAILAKIIKDGNCFFLKEDYCDKNGEPFDGFQGMYSLGANSQTKPLVIDRDKTPLTESDGRPYAGCMVNAQIDVWAQDNSFGRRVNAQLAGVQFYKDGEAFTGGRPADPDDFDSLEDTGEEMADDLT